MRRDNAPDLPPLSVDENENYVDVLLYPNASGLFDVSVGSFVSPLGFVVGTEKNLMGTCHHYHHNDFETGNLLMSHYNSQSQVILVKN